jgi:hypothetical protein
MLCGGAFIISLGQRLFDVWIGPGRFIGYPTLIVFIVLLTLEAHSFIIVTSSRATEDEAFAVWALAAGLLKLAGSWLLMQRYGLFGIAAGSLLAQLLTNHWYMGFRGLRRLGMSLREHTKRVLLPCVGVFAVAGAMNLFSLQLTRQNSTLIQVIAGGAITALVFGIACWWLVLARAERTRLLGFVGLSTSGA